MKKGIIITIIVAMFGWAVYDYVSKSKDSKDFVESDEVEELEEGNDNSGTDEVVKKDTVGLNKGELAPNFELTTMDGETVKLTDFRGKRVMLNFWATWCGPCRAEMPDMQKFYEDEDVEILAVNLTASQSGEKEKIPKFTDEYGITFPILLDENSDVSTLYQIQPIPTSYLIDSEGRIHNKAFGALNYDLMVQEFNKMK